VLATVAKAAGRDVSGRPSAMSRHHTGTVGSSVTNDAGSFGSIGASLIGAVANAVTEVCISAIAGNIAHGTAELAHRFADHAIDAGTLR